MLHKSKEWFVRYAGAELIATVCALTGAHSVYLLNRNPDRLLVALSATWCENFGFYGVLIVREWRRLVALAPESSSARRFGAVVRNLMMEFGAAEAFDTLLIRPAAMYLGLTIFSDLTAATLFGKVIADGSFYLLAICGYELRKKIFH